MTASSLHGLSSILDPLLDAKGDAGRSIVAASGTDGPVSTTP